MKSGSRNYSFIDKVIDDSGDAKLLTHSGLILSGANNTLQGDSDDNTYNDGILTAYEISHLDLSKCKLAVLSACETGLGDIVNDGVIGLQRGFKKAGVSTLLMSLWEVDDNTTYLLMTSFYKAVLRGMSFISSLRMAQENVRREGYEDPYYWAGWIIMDSDE